jgi:hypothetical protein
MTLATVVCLPCRLCDERTIESRNRISRSNRRFCRQTNERLRQWQAGKRQDEGREREREWDCGEEEAVRV